jgi:hypothetical protein
MLSEGNSSISERLNNLNIKHLVSLFFSLLLSAHIIIQNNIYERRENVIQSFNMLDERIQRH